MSADPAYCVVCEFFIDGAAYCGNCHAPQPAEPRGHYRVRVEDRERDRWSFNAGSLTAAVAIASDQRARIVWARWTEERKP